MNFRPRSYAISVRDLIVGFGQQTVLDSLSLDVYRGEILGLVGASGGGRSLYLRTIIGLLPKRRGRIEVLGTDFDASPADEVNDIGSAGHPISARRTLPPLTVLQNIQFPMREHLDLSQSLMDEVALTKLGES